MHMPIGPDPHALFGILDGMRAGVCVTDAEGRYAFVNAAYCDLYGYRAEELIGHHFTLVVPEDFRAQATRLHDDFIAGAVEVGGEWTVLRKDGRPLNIEAQAGRFRDREGRPFKVTTVVDTSRRKATEEALRASQVRLAEAQRLANLGHWEIDLRSGRMSWSEQIHHILGTDPRRFKPSREALLEALEPEERKTLETARARALEGHGGYRLTLTLSRRDNSLPRVVRERGEVAFGAGGVPVRLFGTLMDVTLERAREEELRRLSQVVEQNSAIVLITDLKGVIEYANPRLTEVTGFSVAEVIGATPALFKSGLTPAETYRQMWRALAEGGEWRGELLNKRRDGSLYWERAHLFALHGPGGEVTQYVAIKEDITDRKQAEAELLRAHTFDPVSGLGNRRAAFDQLAERIAKRGAKDRFALILVNLDGFSRLVETFGLKRSDRVLATVAERLSRVSGRHCWLLARIGGDRFCLAVEGFASTAEVELTARAILKEVAAPLTLKDQTLRLTATLGLALYPGDGDSVDLLVRNAEAAVRQAQARGPDSYRFFLKPREPGRSLTLESDLAEALERGELWLAYQPLVRAGGESTGEPPGRWAGVEALIRWRHPRLGPISPGEFVPLFEGTDLVHRLGAWVVETAIRDLIEIRRRLGRDLFVSVNVSPRQLKRAEFAERVAGLLEETGLPPESLDLEITERLFVEHRPEVLGVLEALDGLGVGITLDDFGTGYSALGTLLELPLKVLKIDRRFVDKATPGSREHRLVAAVVAMCRDLHIRTVAEGIETREQAEALADLGADLLQGYLFGRPAPLDELLAAGERQR